MKRIASEHITTLEPNQIFVFGSNESGIHGAGAAWLAQHKFGAKAGKGFGLSGQSFAIPTKDKQIETLPISNIQQYVNEFLNIAKATPQYTYLVTQIGCGLAGYTPEEIAPLFKDAVDIENVHLPEKFWNILTAIGK